MNTTKQVNVMIGLLFLAFLVFGAYIMNENRRAEAARDTQDALLAERGATLFVNGCRTCHGLEGQGVNAGGIAPQLNSSAYLILAANNSLGLPATADGDARNIREFLFNTISCGRTNTPMPPWSDRQGGALSDTQINYLVAMITQARWDLVQRIGEEHDAVSGQTAKDILVTDPAALSITTKNCGQYSGTTAKEFRERNPFATTTAPAASAAPVASATAAAATGGGSSGGGAGSTVAVTLKEWSIASATAQGSAGRVEFDVKNTGAIPHEFTVVKTNTAQDKLEQKSGTVDESKVQVIGRTDQFGNGEEKKLTVTLQPGNYVLLCNVVGHYQLGMHAAFTAR